MNRGPRRRHSVQPRVKPLSRTESAAIIIIVLAVVTIVLALIIGGLTA